jgi:ribonuclease P protein component
MNDQRLLPKYRIRSAMDFRRIYQRRCTASDDLLLIFGSLNGLPYPRFGMSVSRKIGGAVVRNRWKRLLREAFRLSRKQLPEGVDLIIVVRKQAEPALEQLQQSLIQLAGRLAIKLARES